MRIQPWCWVLRWACRPRHRRQIEPECAVPEQPPAVDPAATAMRLRPDSKDLDRLVRQTVVLMTALDADGEDIGVKRLLLTDPIIEAHDDVDKVTWALVDHTDAGRSPFTSLPSPSRPRMLAPDGRYEHAVSAGPAAGGRVGTAGGGAGQDQPGA